MASWSITPADLGWSAELEAAFAPHAAAGLCAARLLRDHKAAFTCMAFDGDGFHEREAVLSGRMRHQSRQRALAPAVGDWVAVDLRPQPCVIHASLPRRNTLRRQHSGPAMRQQILVANVDCVAVVTDAEVDYNPRRLERFLAMIQSCEAKPLIVLNKTDLCTATRLKAVLRELGKMLPAADILQTNARRGSGIGLLRRRLLVGQTLAFIGSSGVGKSTLINRLIGERWQDTEEVNPKTGRGRHTTTYRELILLKRGGMVVDNPGIKEVEAVADAQAPASSLPPGASPSLRARPRAPGRPKNLRLRNLQDRREQESQLHPNRRLSPASEAQNPLQSPTP